MATEAPVGHPDLPHALVGNGISKTGNQSELFKLLIRLFLYVVHITSPFVGFKAANRGTRAQSTEHTYFVREDQYRQLVWRA